MSSLLGSQLDIWQCSLGIMFFIKAYYCSWVWACTLSEHAMMAKVSTESSCKMLICRANANKRRKAVFEKTQNSKTKDFKHIVLIHFLQCGIDLHFVATAANTVRCSQTDSDCLRERQLMDKSHSLLVKYWSLGWYSHWAWGMLAKPMSTFAEPRKSLIRQLVLLNRLLHLQWRLGLLS